MSDHGTRFDREFTPDDLAIVNLGYWDSNAEDDSADSVPVAEDVEPTVAESEPAEHEVAVAPLEAEATEEAEDFEAAETAEDFGSSGSSDNSEELQEPQEPAPRESKEPATKAAKIPAGGPSTAPSVAVDAEAEFSKVEAIPGGVKSAIEAILAVAEAPVSVRELSAALIVANALALSRNFAAFVVYQAIVNPNLKGFTTATDAIRIYKIFEIRE